MEVEKQVPPEAKITIAVLAVLILVENLLVCCFVYRHHNLRTFTNCFVVSLALSDVLFATVIVPSNFLASDKAVLNSYFISLVLLVNIGNICAVTLDRYIAVFKPMMYSYTMAKHFRKILLLAWTIPISYSLLPLCWGSDLSSKAQSIYLLCMLVMIIAPYLFILFVYIRIFREVSKLDKNSAKLRTSNLVSDNNAATKEGNRISGEVRVARLFAIIAGIFILSWLPVIYMTIALAIKRLDIIPELLPVISWFTLTLGTLLNAPLYAFYKGDFRKAIMKSLGLRKNKNNAFLLNPHQETASIVIDK